MQNNHYNRGSRNDELVDKIHGVMAKYRSDRDELFRKKSLAVERLRLIREEKDALEKTVHSMREKVGALKAQASGQAQMELEDLKGKVENLSEEVQFQHGELVKKQDKVSNLRKTMEQDKFQREQALRNAQEAIRKLQNQEPPTYNLKPETAWELLQVEMNGDLGRLWAEWPRILREHAEEINDQASKLQHSNAELEGAMIGYSKEYGLNDHCEENNDAMTEG